MNAMLLMVLSYVHDEIASFCENAKNASLMSRYLSMLNLCSNGYIMFSLCLSIMISLLGVKDPFVMVNV